MIPGVVDPDQTPLNFENRNILQRSYLDQRLERERELKVERERARECSRCDYYDILYTIFELDSASTEQITHIELELTFTIPLQN